MSNPPLGAATLPLSLENKATGVGVQGEVAEYRDGWRERGREMHGKPRRDLHQLLAQYAWNGMGLTWLLGRKPINSG